VKNERRISVARRLGGLGLATLFLLPYVGRRPLEAQQSDIPQTVAAPTPQMPMEDRLAEPVLPASPTEVDIGRNLYYFHCMPCHGDRGQGLTDEWRAVWVEDHQNCWGRGCHTGRSDLSAFPIPRTIPAVIGSPQALSAFQTADDLFVFLRETQPPQRPGALTEPEYWALTSFLLHENGRPLPEGGRGAPVSSAGLAFATLAPLLAMLSVAWLARRPEGPAS
jgi:mono/diheme cytochrome c family protein